MSSCEVRPRKKKSSSPSYGDEPSFIQSRNTSATRAASSALNVQSVPFSACRRSSSLSERFPGAKPAPLFFRPGVSSAPAPFAGNTTEFRGVVVARGRDCDEGDGGVEPSIERERSQSSDCEPFECNESVDSEKSRSLDAIRTS